MTDRAEVRQPATIAWITSSLRRLLSAFAIRANGNTAMMFALMMVPIILLLGGGVDVMRTHSARLSLKSAADGAALAAASLTQTGNAEEVVKDYLASNLGPHEDVIENLEFTISEVGGL